MSFEITNMRRVNLGKLRAWFSVEWPDKMIINDCKLMEGADGKLWAGMPSKPYEKDGQKKWFDIVKIYDKALMAKISEKARLAYGGETKPETTDDIPF